MVEFRSKFDGRQNTALINRTFKKLLWLFVVLSTVIIVMGIVAVAVPEDQSDVGLGIAVIVFGVLITPLGYFLSRFMQRSNNKASMFISPDTEEIYTFDEEYITITQKKGDEFFATSKAKYSYIHKAYEDKKFYYLYISKVQSHVIEKSSLTQGTLEELSSLLKTNLGRKFKAKKD